ncbi:MAG: PHP domain-containing protein [bacterium]|nr:PHP domain-containing protein [bacterium]
MIAPPLVDFHLHSSYSDGSENIASIIDEAKKRNIKAIALTDHNTGKGVNAFAKACAKNEIATLEGVEIYAAFPKTEWATNPAYCGQTPDLVILGKTLNWKIFIERYQISLEQYRKNHWLPKTLEKLREAGLEVLNLNKKEIDNQCNFGVPPVLRYIAKNPKNWPVIFEITKQYEQYEQGITMESIVKNPVYFAGMYLYGVGKPAYVPRVFSEWTVTKAVKLAREMGGVLFAAHPGGNYAKWSKEHLDYFVQMGGGGIEVWQYHHKPDQIKFFLQYAIKNNLLISGGSDWHGKNSSPTLGCWDKPENQTPLWATEKLFERLE